MLTKGTHIEQLIDRSQKQRTVTYKHYVDDEFRGAAQVTLEPDQDPEEWVQSLNDGYRRLYYSGLLTFSMRLELFAIVGV